MAVFYDDVEDEVVDENRVYSGTLAQVTQKLVAETSANSTFQGLPPCGGRKYTQKMKRTRGSEVASKNTRIESFTVQYPQA